MAFSFSRIIVSIITTVFLIVALSVHTQAAQLMAGGLVVDAKTGAPLPGVTVAVFDSDGKVVDTDITDEYGLWAVPVKWDHCHLRAAPSGRGLFSTIVGVAMWPVRTVVDAVGIVGSPVKSALKGAVRAAGGAAAAGVGVAAAAGGGPIAAAAAGTAARSVGTYAVDQAFEWDEQQQQPQRVDRNALVGQVRVRAWTNTHQEYTGTTGIYMLDAVEDEKGKEVPLAIVDSIRLAKPGTGLMSDAPREFGIFRDVRVEPAIAPAGSKVTVSAHILVPENLLPSVWMVARNLETRQDFVLEHIEGTLWQAELELPQRGPHRNHQISIVAYRDPNEDKKRDKGVEGRIERQGAWDPKKPFPVDPALLVSRNRGYAVVTVTKP